MKPIVVYDSQYGNTKKVAEAMADAITGTAVAVGEFRDEHLSGITLLIVGTPVQGGRPTEKIQAFLKKMPTDVLKGKRVAVFDTRFEESKQNFALKALMRTIGYASPKMADVLNAKGAPVAVPPEGFIVLKKQGPLKEGELERAGTWARKLVKTTLR